MTRTKGLEFRSLRRRRRLMSGVVPTSRIALLSCVDEMPSVYSGSTSWPPQVARVSITRWRVFACTPSRQSVPWTT